MQSLFSWPSTTHPSGWVIYISSSKSPFKKFVLISIWWITNLWIATKAIKILMEEILVIGEKVSKKSMFGFWVNPLTTNLALYLYIDPLGLNFLLKIHLHPIGFAPSGTYTKLYVLFFLIESILILVACSQRFASVELITTEKLKGSSSIRYV